MVLVWIAPLVHFLQLFIILIQLPLGYDEISLKSRIFWSLYEARQGLEEIWHLLFLTKYFVEDWDEWMNDWMNEWMNEWVNEIEAS